VHNKGYRWQHEAVIALAGHENACPDASGSRRVVPWSRCLS
jgi:hypothetical protein